MTLTDQGNLLATRLPRIIARAAEKSRDHQTEVLTSLAIEIEAVDPIDLFEAADGQERSLWVQPSERFSMLGVGRGIALESEGATRFADASMNWRRLVATAIANAPTTFPLRLPVGLGGFAFDHLRPSDPAWTAFPDGRLTVPRYLFISKGGRSWVCLNVLAHADMDKDATASAELADLQALLSRRRTDADREPADFAPGICVDPHAERWTSAVEQVIESIRSGLVEKVVVARQIQMMDIGCTAAGTALRRLRDGYENCTIFAFAEAEACFLGATPERLVRLEGREARVDCLAGSVRRGMTTEEDVGLANGLRADPKERHEHSLVVRAVTEALAPICHTVAFRPDPGLRQMANVQHLHTPVNAVLDDGQSVVDLVERLHPTPACGGVPRAEALALIRRHEPFDRGWYAGPVGWIDGDGGGEFAVAIRSGLLTENKALLYAGCGIVDGSDPDREYQESCLKLRPMLCALRGKPL